MIHRLLIANRGEIACRIIRTCRALGIETVAVYSDADATLPHVIQADQAIRLGPAAARESYLDIEKVIAAAQQSGADAIHPGYGFLSENAAFAKACDTAGLIFVGPGTRAIQLMGDKAAARQHMAQHQVPVLPGFDREGASDDDLLAATGDIGFPLLIKAVAGGGGKGMRVVQRADDFADALAAARREARGAFNDDRVLLERYLEQARHVEVQVFADRHGNAVHLFERDCSVQRRHQKIIEEAPAPGVSDALRQQLGEAAVRAAQAIDYHGAGTVEFLLAPDGQFYFMEMNTRLQVEHPVTELITGEDLVAWQLTVAAGGALPKQQADLRIQGHAMEVRLYAEDPARQFMPSSGVLAVCEWPQQTGLRVDTGFGEGDRVSDHYDPMLAKIICFGDDRDQARRRLAQALSHTRISGIRHNIPFLISVLQHPAFAQAELSTRFLEQHQPATGVADDSLPLRLCAAALCWRDQLHARADDDPWSQLSGWQHLAPPRFVATLLLDDSVHTVTLEGADEALKARCDDQRLSLHWQRSTGRLTDNHTSRSLSANARLDGERMHLFSHGHTDTLLLNPDLGNADDATRGAAFAAPMNGTVVACHVSAGSRVDAGAAVITMEAMKMEHTLRAPAAGVVRELPFAAGDTVNEGALLAVFEADDTENAG
ncbi:acetyl-CoA carboxylase, biotin carboxylase [Alcanivorax sp. S71-1-4]|uniref:acetyl/propionyl/methylcrotonyl-CoA carboxylase subunit alpha n=1 Tax=Alcanivorax sp. S71-1-4 TaxID=1177159 RepID=UPI001358CCBF|nr:acetyl-CoA carboxylase biotin carboxylase subunit [Alcanivorax sp. S71-1-4]KAF0809221.1 acetyl-CoA carboxylase, biotin carboxylase [Alcanivorax sp. S71-1-4]